MVAHLSVLLVVLLSAGVSGGCTLLGPEELPGVSNWQNGDGAPKEVSGVAGTTDKSTRACLREGDMPVPDEMLVCGAAIGRLICWLSLVLALPLVRHHVKRGRSARPSHTVDVDLVLPHCVPGRGIDYR